MALRNAAIFLIMATFAAFYGFTGSESVITQAAQLLFIVFLILFMVSVIFGYPILKQKSSSRS